jgi:hypothetical protein
MMRFHLVMAVMRSHLVMTMMAMMRFHPAAVVAAMTMMRFHPVFAVRTSLMPVHEAGEMMLGVSGPSVMREATRMPARRRSESKRRMERMPARAVHHSHSKRHGGGSGEVAPIGPGLTMIRSSPMAVRRMTAGRLLGLGTLARGLASRRVVVRRRVAFLLARAVHPRAVPSRTTHGMAAHHVATHHVAAHRRMRPMMFAVPGAGVLLTFLLRFIAVLVLAMMAVGVLTVAMLTVAMLTVAMMAVGVFAVGVFAVAMLAVAMMAVGVLTVGVLTVGVLTVAVMTLAVLTIGLVIGSHDDRHFARLARKITPASPRVAWSVLRPIRLAAHVRGSLGIFRVMPSCVGRHATGVVGGLAAGTARTATLEARMVAHLGVPTAETARSTAIESSRTGALAGTRLAVV